MLQTPDSLDQFAHLVVRDLGSKTGRPNFSRPSAVLMLHLMAPPGKPNRALRCACSFLAIRTRK
jgi:hypothetical protein